MGKIDLLKAGTAFLWKTPSKSSNFNKLCYVAEDSGKLTSFTDEFVRTSNPVESVLSKTAQMEAKKISKLDKEFFHGYMMVKRYEFPVTKAEIEELLQHDGDDLVNHTIDFAMKKWKIPQSLKPNIFSLPQHKDIFMAYDYVQNLVYLNPNRVASSKAESLGYIIHEICHQRQNLDVLRTEGIGEKTVRAYAREFAKKQTDNIKQLVQKYSIEEFKALNQPENAVNEFIYLKNLKKSDPKAYEQNFVNLSKQFENSQAQALEEFRQRVISEMGELKSGSKQGERAKKYLKSFMTNYFKKDGSLQAGKYNFNVAEREALDIGFSFEEKVKTKDENGFCFIRFAKQFVPKVTDDAQKKHMENEIKQSWDEISKKVSFNEYLKYVYD